MSSHKAMHHTSQLSNHFLLAMPAHCTGCIHAAHQQLCKGACMECVLYGTKRGNCSVNNYATHTKPMMHARPTTPTSTQHVMAVSRSLLRNQMTMYAKIMVPAKKKSRHTSTKNMAVCVEGGGCVVLGTSCKMCMCHQCHTPKKRTDECIQCQQPIANALCEPQACVVLSHETKDGYHCHDGSPCSIDGCTA